MPVWRVEIEVPDDFGFQVEGLLSDHDISSWEIQDSDSLGGASPVAEGRLRFVAYTDPDRGPILVASAQTSLSVAEVCGGPFEDQAWTEIWKQFIPTVVIADKAVVRPPFHPSPRPELPEIVIDPGMAFGTGGHETTQLVTELALKWSSRISQPNDVLQLADVGCGTGVVSAVLAKLMDVEVDACDIDPEAVRVAYEVCSDNEVLSSINIKEGSAGDLGRSYPLVIANILGEILLKIAPELDECCTKGTILIVSGILKDESKKFLAQFSQTIKADVLEEQSKGIWTAYVLCCTS